MEFERSRWRGFVAESILSHSWTREIGLFFVSWFVSSFVRSALIFGSRANERESKGEDFMSLL